MAMRDAVRLPPRTIANCATKTAAFYKFHNNFLTLSHVGLPSSGTKTIFPKGSPRSTIRGPRPLSTTAEWPALLPLTYRPDILCVSTDCDEVGSRIFVRNNAPGEGCLLCARAAVEGRAGKR